MRHRCALFVLGALACAGGPPPPAPPVPLRALAGEISADELRRDLFAFAADSMRGRETGTADAERAARFLVQRLQALGLEPGGDSLYLQRVPLERESIDTTSRFTVIDGTRTTELRAGVDIAPLINLGAGVPPTKLRADGEIVFAGYGVALSRPKRDDLSGLDLAGKVVVVVNGAPAGVDSATRATLESPAAISDRLARILPYRPAAIVVLLVGDAPGMFEQVVQQFQRSVVPRSTHAMVSEEDRPLPMIMLGMATRGSPLVPARWPSDDRPQQHTGRTLSARADQQRAPFSAYNVIAVLRGSDPTLRSTYVALGAHYDHIGIVKSVDGDSIANGADDDGSGSVGLLSIARALAQAETKPRRSTLFVWHVGEEQGLLGSAYFVDHPTVPIDSIVAQLTVDMIGRNAPALLYTVGPRAAPNRQSRRLGAIVDSVNALQPQPFGINRTLDVWNHPEHVYERSDHFNYARKGIPIVFFTTGEHADYHAPSDEAGKIDYGKLARVARLLRDVALAVANSSARPR